MSEPWRTQIQLSPDGITGEIQGTPDCHQATHERAPAVPGLEATPGPHTPVLAGSTGCLRAICPTPDPPPCDPGFHCRGHIGQAVGVKKPHISLCLQLWPCLQVPALRAAFLYGDTAPAPLPAAAHTWLTVLLWTSLCCCRQTWAVGLHRACSKREEEGKPCSNKHLNFSTDTVVGFQAPESFFFSFPQNMPSHITFA